jgi:AcrR family transcriptional regulator
MNLENENLDLRTRRTRKLLQAALFDLLKERDLEMISVRDICERAMVHRTTFYKHYVDKYDLMNRGSVQMFEELSKDIPTPGEAVAAYSAAEPPPHFVRIFQHAGEHRDFYALMLSTGGNTPFRKLFEQYLVDQAQGRIRALVKEKLPSPPPIPDEILAYYSAGAAVKVLSWWLEQKNPPSPVEMAAHISRLLSFGILAVLGIKNEGKPA